MTNTKQIKQDEKKGVFSPVGIAVTGAVVGAGIAVAGAFALKNEKNREKVKDAFKSIKKQAAGYMEDMQKQAQDKKDEVSEKLTEGKEKLIKVAKATPKS